MLSDIDFLSPLVDQAEAIQITEFQPFDYKYQGPYHLLIASERSERKDGETLVGGLRSNLRDTGRVVTFRAEVAKMKASKWLNEHVTYVDPEGVTIDPALLATDEPDDRDA